jgi:hypothetical protein
MPPTDKLTQGPIGSARAHRAPMRMRMGQSASLRLPLFLSSLFSTGNIREGWLRNGFTPKNIVRDSQGQERERRSLSAQPFLQVVRPSKSSGLVSILLSAFDGLFRRQRNGKRKVRHCMVNAGADAMPAFASRSLWRHRTHPRSHRPIGRGVRSLTELL